MTTARDEEILASTGLTMRDIDEMAEACEAGDYSMWDVSKVSYAVPSGVSRWPEQPPLFAGQLAQEHQEGDNQKQ